MKFLSKKHEMSIIRTFVFIIRTHRKARLLYNIFDKVHLGKSIREREGAIGNRDSLNDCIPNKMKQCRP